MAFNHGCSKCRKLFRCTKEKESLCATCLIEVKMKNGPEFPHLVDEEFKKLAEKVYGGCDASSSMFDVNVTDVFKHEERLLKIKSNLEAKNPKERNRIGREVDRILEEHDVIQKKLLQSQEKMMKIMLFKQLPESSSRTGAPTPVVSSPVRPQANHRIGPPTPPRQSSMSTTTASVSSLSSPSSPIKKFSPAKVHTSPLTPTSNPDRVTSSTKLQIELPVPNIKKAGVIHLPKVDVPDLITPERAEETEDDDDQIAPLRRSNSVRNQIKAFEELNRRASTGAYDNRDRDVPRRKLRF